MSVHVAVSSDRHAFCERTLLAIGSDVELIGKSFTGRTRVRLAHEARVDVVMLDFHAEEALAVCADLSNRHRVLMADLPAFDDSAVDALTAGASGILYRGAYDREVTRAVWGVFRGELWAPRHVVAATWMKCRKQAQRLPAVEVSLDDRLSAREREVLRCAAAGFGNKQIASHLAISEATVKVHLTHIFQKLGLRGRGELAAAYHGIIQ
jgi:DNA-binding NarL/FixJ family response regulator